MSALSHDVGGEGRPVLLLHAGVADRRMWGGVASGLMAAGYRVIAPDLPGFGETAMPSGPFSHTDLVLGLQVELGAVPAVVVGNSFGSLVALHLAIAHPDAVGCLVLISTPSDTREPSETLRAFWEEEERLLEAGDVEGATELNLAMWMRDGRESDADLVRDMQRRAFELQAQGVALEPPAQSQWPDSATARPGSIGARTLVVTGDRDVEDFAAIGDELAAEIPGARRVRIATGGHLLPLEQPAVVVGLILDHIGR